MSILHKRKMSSGWRKANVQIKAWRRDVCARGRALELNYADTSLQLPDSLRPSCWFGANVVFGCIWSKTATAVICPAWDKETIEKAVVMTDSVTMRHELQGQKSFRYPVQFERT